MNFFIFQQIDTSNHDFRGNVVFAEIILLACRLTEMAKPGTTLRTAWIKKLFPVS